MNKDKFAKPTLIRLVCTTSCDVSASGTWPDQDVDLWLTLTNLIPISHSVCITENISLLSKLILSLSTLITQIK